MKSRHLYWYWLLSFGFFLALFFAQFSPVSAAYKQLDDTTLSTGATSNALETFHGIAGNWISIKLKSTCSGNSTLLVRQWDNPPTWWNSSYSKNWQYVVEVSCGDEMIFNNATSSWSYSDPYQGVPEFDPTKYYGIMLYGQNGQVKGSTGDTYANGIFYDDANFSTDATISDEYFYLITDLSPDITNDVSIPTISNSSSTAFSFHWQYHLDSATTSWGYYSIFSDWDLYKCDPTCATKIGSNLGYNSHPNNNIATGTTAGFNLDNGTYQIKNFYLKYDDVGQGNLTASTTKVNSNEFTISFETPYIPIISLPTSTIASTTPIQITCDPNDPWYSYSLCKIGVWLFVPNQSVLNQFSNLTTDISSKPPIGYFTGIKNALSGFTSSTPAFTIDVSSDDPVNTTFFTPIRTGLIWILWLAFAFWLFHRFRHFNFTSP